ncbi:hypothetical protein SAMN03159298_00450 [Pseudomonas sp. NFACC07-1]|nr:hypothetical protein SAMN03159424_00397 [Pseudomonas sp. NFACC05-1]SEI46991.1 hypothetical protein SAMN03159298_00450 [Pseudomonas sp. NFACC07-1]
MKQADGTIPANQEKTCGSSLPQFFRFSAPFHRPVTAIPSHLEPAHFTPDDANLLAQKPTK